MAPFVLAISGGFQRVSCMKKVFLFAGLSALLALTQIVHATPVSRGTLSVSGGIKLNVERDILAKSTSFTIVENSPVPSPPAATPKSAGSASPAAAGSVSPAEGRTARPGNAQAAAGPGRVAPTLSSLGPVVASLVDASGTTLGASTSSRYGYGPGQISVAGHGTPVGLQPFSPTPAKPAPQASVPDGGETAVLLGIGLLGAVLMKKRFAAQERRCLAVAA